MFIRSGTFILIAINFLFLLSTRTGDAQSLPNIVVILTDDQDVVLNGMTPLEKTQKLLGNRGASFSNAFTSTSTCCPSRSSLLSGQYAHNHGTVNNTCAGNCYGEIWRKHIETRTIPVFLQTKGYDTFYAGKYLNQYYSDTVPPGYKQWFGLHGNSRYYNYTLNENGVLKKYGNKEEDYLTDVLKNHAIHFLSNQTTDKPFFAILSTPACHAPFTPAKRHEQAFADVRALQTPSFNIQSGVLDKHWLVRMPPSPLPESVLQTIDVFYRKRWQTLLAVDELVEAVYEKLTERGLLDNTYIIFTSDNGYHLGQFSMPFDKRQPYDTDIRVPLIVTGPNIKTKLLVDKPVALIDIAPTIYDWANITKPDWLDGESFANVMDVETNLIDENVYDEVDQNNETTNARFEEIPYERQFLIEYWGEGTAEKVNPECPYQRQDRLSLCTVNAGCHCQDSWNNTYSCVRHIANDLNKVYCQFYDRENFVEAYDLLEDPHQIVNLGFDMLPSERTQYSLVLDKLRICQGAACRRFGY